MMTRRTTGLAPALLLGAVALGAAGPAGCATTEPAATRGPADEDVDRAADMLTGWFDSRDQAARAPDDFLEIRLVMIPIWSGRTDGRWLYVEQAAASAVERPYRQRVYHVHRDAGGTLRSDVYTLPGDPLARAACWTSAAPLADLSPADLELRAGCSIRLTPTAGGFEGATDGTGCTSTLRGAAYATSEVVIRSDLLVSWDRGWDAAGAQVWGATKGGYEFVKRGDGPPPS